MPLSDKRRKAMFAKKQKISRIIWNDDYGEVARINAITQTNIPDFQRNAVMFSSTSFDDFNKLQKETLINVLHHQNKNTRRYSNLEKQLKK